MRVSSPVGEFPFSIERVGLRDGQPVIFGRMGRWPSEVRIEPSDLKQLACVTLAPASVLAVGAVARRRRRHRARTP